MTSYPASATVADARARYFADNGFSEADYHARWVRFRVGRLPVVFPNTASRRRAVPLHDLHHIATGYQTSLTGEAEISAWELAAGCGDYWAAWLLNSGGFALGLLIAPRRTYRAFVRGRRCRALYHQGWRDSLLTRTVGELRTDTGTDRPVGPPRWRDRLAFAGWAATVAATPMLGLAGLVALLA